MQFRLPGFSKLEIVRQGFTLLELTLVTAIIVLLAAAMAPRMSSSYRSLELTAAVRELAATTDYAATQAIRERQPVKLCFIDGQAEYWLEMEQEKASSPKNNDHAKPERLFAERRSLPAGFKIHLEKQSQAEANESRTKSISFTPTGSTDACLIRISSAGGKSRWLRYGDALARVEITNRPPASEE